MLSILFLIGLVVVGCKGQTNKIFLWQFKDQVLPNELGTCIPYQIVVKPFNATGNLGIAPYYMISFPIGGIPVSTPIGSDPDNLSWKVTHPAGSKLLLSVVDSTGGAGGVPTQLPTVIEGQTTQCVSTPAESSPFTVKANVTSTLETCQPWGITVSGGTPPYKITLAQTGSFVVTNVTMPFGNNRFTFPNRALPGGSLIAAISDLEGRWASGTPAVTPIGSDDVTCLGFAASSGDAATIDAQDAVFNAKLTASKRRKSLVTGIAVTLALLLLIGCTAMWYLGYRRRAKIQRKRLSEQRARQYATAITSEARASRAPIYEKRSRMPPEMPPMMISEPDVQAPPYQEFEPGAASIASIGYATTGGIAFERVERPPRLMSLRNTAPQMSLQSSRRDLPRPLTEAAQSRFSIAKTTQSSSGATAFIPAVKTTIPAPQGRKNSARFVMFPQQPVRTPVLRNPPNASGEEYKGGDSGLAKEEQ